MQIITPFQDNLIKQFSAVRDADHFYFTGGTALSLFYLKHRKSEDLDFFTGAVDLIVPFTQLLSKHFESSGFSVALKRGYHTFTELIISNGPEETLVHLGLDADFYLQPLQEFPDYPGLKVNSLADIAVNKLLALFGRAALRDFIDVYYLVKASRFSKNQLIDYAKQKDPGFDLYWLGIAFERLKLYQQKDYDLSLVFDPLKEEDLASFFAQWRKEIAQSLP